ncbi:MAG TPA: agmatinase family protein [Bacteroidia bacterium]|nr:agmatinase family protein [Bacteroidia bacterium]
MSKQDKINGFDPNGLGDANNNIFGLPFTPEEAEVVFIPVPWEVTVSYTAGTALGPQAIFDASFQVDLFDPKIKDAWKIGIAMEPVSDDIASKSENLRRKSEQYIGLLQEGESSESNSKMEEVRVAINAECEKLNKWVRSKALSYLEKNKIIALIGGDHSTPLGLMQALAEKHQSFAILQIDAHADLRDAYEGFEFSHASIMFNALKIPQVSKLVQVGIRDYCEAEYNIIKESNGRIITFFDRDIKHKQYDGNSWTVICNEIIAQLPDDVYLSFDIDGLDPKLCPNTGTPVAGGFEFEQVLLLIEKIVDAGKRIIAFDLNEVAPGGDEWDANVGARLLYRLANMAAISNGRTVQ